jgi:hypothetical protein
MKTAVEARKEAESWLEDHGYRDVEISNYKLFYDDYMDEIYYLFSFSAWNENGIQVNGTKTISEN